MTRVTLTNIEGSYPSLDRKKVSNPFVAAGRNFIVDLDGPKSAFGCTKTHKKFAPAQLMQSFPVGDTIFYFGRDADETYLQISQLDWPSRQITTVGKFISSDLTRPALRLPWSHALVGTYHYFANRTWGVLQYDPVADNWVDVTSTIGIANIFFICESGGRLCCLAEGIASWSAIDDGMDNTPSTATGAGAQALSLVGTLEKNSDYLGIQKVSRGFLSFTSKGVMRSELIDSIIPFRHLPGEAKLVPFSAWCVTKITETDVIMLTRFGLYISADGVEFEEYQAIQNEYFKQTEIPSLGGLRNGYVALHYSIARDELYVSFTQNQDPSNYTKAWVLYLKRDAWGLFNRGHKGFVFLDTTGESVQYEQAFVDTAGRVCLLNNSANVTSIEAVNTFGSYFQELIEFTPRQIEGVNILATNCRMAGFSGYGLPAVAGFYELAGASETYKTENTGPTATVVEGAVNDMPSNVTVNSGLILLGKTVQEPMLNSLNSYVEVGLVRLTDEQQNDQLTFITNVAISCLDATESDLEPDDWLLDYETDLFEDWLTATGSEDWGLAAVAGSDYSQQIRGSLDGYQTFEDQLQDLEEVQTAGKTKFCSCECVGVFQSVIVSAEDVGQSFHLKTLEFTGTLAGRL